MSATARFQKFAGKSVRVMHPKLMGPLFLRVLADDDLDDDGMIELVGDLHPKGKLEAGWTVVAIEGEIEDGEADAGGFLAVNEAKNEAYLCDSGTIVKLEGPANGLEIELDDDGDGDDDD